MIRKICYLFILVIFASYLAETFIQPCEANSYKVLVMMSYHEDMPGQEQGLPVSEMLLKAMGGTPVPEIPITRNQLGQRLLNVSILQALGIKPKHNVFLGTELVKTTQ